MRNIEKLKVLIAGAERIILVGHVNPDGDSIGSLMGMNGYLEEMGKVVMAVVPNNYPYFLQFLDPGRKIKIFNQAGREVIDFIHRADLIICMDFNALRRIDELGEVISGSSAVKVLIDHHPQPEPVFDLMYSDTASSSTCELVYWIIKEMHSGIKLSQESADALYTGMVTDTNNFANSVRALTFKMAGELLEAGVDKEKIQRKVFGGFNEERMRLMGYMLYDNMKLYSRYNAGIMVLTNEMKQRFGFEEGDSEGFVNLPLSIKSVRVSALFTQEPDCVKVSLRSKDSFSVNRFAREYFNGGGHEKAAGGKVYIPISEVEAYFIRAIGEFMEKEK